MRPEPRRVRAAALAATLAAALAVALAACDSKDPAGPTREAVAGAYVATLFTTTTGGDEENQLARGATLALTLSVQGGTTGRLFIPVQTGAEEVDADLAGTWSLQGSTVTFSHAEDTFVRDATWRVRGNTLTADQTLAGVRVTVVLTKVAGGEPGA